MKYRIAGIAAAVVLAASGVAAATVDSSPPPPPGAWEPSTIAGCWKSVLERHVEQRPVTISGHRFMEFRRVTTYTRWCPRSGYEIVVWRSPWGPGRR